MFQILAAVALDQHFGTKTLLIEVYVTKSIFLNQVIPLDLMRKLNSSQIFLHAACSSLLSTATRDFRPMIGRADFARLAFVLLLVPLAIEEDCLAEAISSNCCQ